MHLGLEDTRHIGKVRIHPQNPDLVYVAALGHAHGPNNQRGVYRSHDGGKTWEQILFASEDVGAHDLAIDPNNPRILYAALWRARRMPHTTYPPKGWPARDARYRFQWTFPILLSPHDPHVLYAAGNHVFRSTDEGNSWEEFSPDLTRNDKSTMEPSGGPITWDNVGTEYYGTIFAFVESSLERGLFWAGSDDGLVHISRDG